MTAPNPPSRAGFAVIIAWVRAQKVRVAVGSLEEKLTRRHLNVGMLNVEINELPKTVNLGMLHRV